MRKRFRVVQMVKLFEKARDDLEGVKNEAEAYMLTKLSLLKWQEKATTLAHKDTNTRMVESQEKVSSLEENLRTKRQEIQERTNELKELESVHNKYMARQEEVEMELRKCKVEFKQFEREDVKHWENSKHMKQIKKLADKLEKDSSKISDLEKEGEKSANLIPKLEENIPELNKVLVEEEKILEEVIENSKVSRLQGELAKDVKEPIDRGLEEKPLSNKAARVQVSQKTEVKSVVAQFCVDLTARAREGLIDPVISRENEL